jgi:nitroreductase
MPKPRATHVGIPIGWQKVDFILRRRSCRRFLPRSVRDGDLQLMCEVLQAAPTAGNLQPWYFYVVTDSGLKRELADAAYGQGFLAQAPIVFVICAEPERSAIRYGRRGRELYCIQDTAAATQNLLLAATALGYGSCWVGAFNEDKTRKALGIPGHLRPTAIVPVGPGEVPAGPPPKRKSSEILEFRRQREE